MNPSRLGAVNSYMDMYVGVWKEDLFGSCFVGKATVNGQMWTSLFDCHSTRAHEANSLIPHGPHIYIRFAAMHINCT